MTDLGTLGGNNSQAFDVNNHGQVVGWAETADRNGEAFLWQEGTMTGLESLAAAPEAICHFLSWPYVRLGLD